MKNSLNLISVIIPCYNAEKTIVNCINSVLNQTYKNLEIIIVNDGSTDKSLKIIKTIKDKRIKIIDKKNEGSWKARIDGIKSASGDYITFIDSDDEYDKFFVEKSYQSLQNEKSDIAIVGYERIDSETKKVLAREMLSFKNSIRLPEDINMLPLINTSNWNKLYKKELFKEIDKIEVNGRICEDLMLNLIAYYHSSKISFVSEVLYSYYVNSNSIINTLKPDDIKGIEDTFINVRNYTLNNYREYLECIDFMALIHLGISLTSRIYQSKDTMRRNLIRNIDKKLRKNHPFIKKFKIRNIKLIIIKMVFNLHLIYAFVAFYSFVIKTLKIDIKW